MATSSSAVGTLSSPGLGSNLDVNSIVTKLMAVESQPLTALDTKEASFQAKLSAYGNLKGALASFQSAVGGLRNSAQFQSLTATPADPSVLSASAVTGAQVGNYAVQVSQLSQPESAIAAGQTNISATIGSGAATTLTFQFGTISGGTLSNGKYTGAGFAQDAAQASGSVVINSSNNSLAGIRDAINAAGIGVNASIINDGSATPYRLVLTAEGSGAASSMRIGVSGDATLQTLLGQDPAGTQNLTQTAAALDANLTINGIAVTSHSNTVADAIQGVTLSLSKIGSTSVNVAASTAATQAGVNAFVNAYNDLSKTLTSLTAYNAATKTAGALQGDFTAQTIQTRMRSTLTTVLTGSSGSLTQLSQIGVSFQKDGSLAVDSTKLQSAMSKSFNDIAGLFAAVGKSTDSLVSYAGANSKTQPGDYAINITALATHGAVTGSSAAGLTINAGVNDQIQFTVDGVIATAVLAPGIYTGDALAAQIQASINGAPAVVAAGASVTATQSAGVLTLTSASYGSSSGVSITGGSAATDLFGASPVSSAGVNVAGTINGIAGKGSGRNLTGAAGTPADGLAIQISGGSTGARGTVHYSQGYAYRLNAVATDLLDSGGVLAGRTDGISASIKDIDKRRDAWTQRLTDIELRYRAQFTRLDTMVSSLQRTSTFLTQQLAALTANNKG